ncbi:MAG: C40 family peptidase [Deltaproteobacteria bacterium]|nr:C40 family peptidase [Deltaproteobacteria bacterium]
MPARIALLGVGVLFGGCAGSPWRYPGPLGPVGRAPPEEVPAGPQDAPQGRVGQRIAAIAEDTVGARRLHWEGKEYGFDCSGFVRYVHARAGLELEGSSADLYARADQWGLLHTRKTPEVGDVAFFEETWDRNGNGRVDDGITHVAVVTSVDAEGTVSMIHRGSSGIAPLAMNLNIPDQRTTAAGVLLNDWLRVASRRDTKEVRRLSGELWVAFGSFWERIADRAWIFQTPEVPSVG